MVFFLGASCTSDQTSTNANGNLNAPVEIMAASFNLDQISQHNTTSDCWMAIEDKVYNVTNYVSSHPGDEAILDGCGQDATSIFKEKDHSQQANELLADYYIGNLKKQ